MIVLIGGRKGVGTTSLAGQLKTVLAESGQSVVVCGPTEWSSNPDWKLDGENHGEREVDWVVIDGGTDLTDELAELWRDADALTLITTTDAASVTSSYRLMKSAVLRGLSLEVLNVVVNQVANQHEAERVGRRLKRCCKQFLGHCHRDPDWLAFDSRWQSGQHTCEKNNLTCDSVDGTRSVSINRDVKSWADRVLFRPRVPHTAGASS